MGRKNSYHQLIFIFSLLLVGLNSVHAQQLDSLRNSEIEAFKRRESAVSILSGGKNLVALKQDNNEAAVVLHIYDQDSLNLINRFSFTKTGEDFNDMNIMFLEAMRDEIWLLYTAQNDSGDKNSLWLTSLNYKGEEVKTLRILDYSPSKRPELRTYEMFYSPNHELMGISSVHDDFKQNEFDVDLFILDADMDKLYDKSVSLPNIKKVNTPSNFTLSNSGEIYFLNGLTDEKSEATTEVGLEKRLYQLFRYNPSKGKLKQYDVSISDKYISDVKMKLAPTGDLYIIGFYNYSYFKGAEGVFLMVIDNETGKIKVSGKKPLDLKVLSDFLSEKKLRRENSIDDLFLDHIFIKENGNILLLSEVYFVVQRVMTGVNAINVSTSKYYNFEEILIMELDPSLNLVKHEVIYKNQKSTNFLNPYWGYTLLNENDPNNLMLVYNFATPRNRKSTVTVTSELRSSSWIHHVFNETSKIESIGKLRVCPRFNPSLSKNYFVLQDDNEFGLFQVIE